MSVQPLVLEWVKNRGIKTLVNAPAGRGRDVKAFTDAGVGLILNVDVQSVDPDSPQWVEANLEHWHPPTDPLGMYKPLLLWDAVYVNCFFCLANENARKTGLGHNPGTDFAKAARNIASWPVKYVIVYDTIYGFDWRPCFREAGLVLVAEEPAPDGPRSRLELWSKPW